MRPLSRVLREEVIAQSVNSTLSANRHMDAVGRERLVPLEQPRGLQPQAWQPTRSPSFLAVLQGKRHRYPPHRSKHRQTRRHSDSSLDLLARSRVFQHGEKIGPQASRSATPEFRGFREARRQSPNTPSTGPIRRRHTERGSALKETHRTEANRPMTTQPKAMRKSDMTARLVPLQPLQRGQRKSVLTHDERKEWKANMLAAQEEAFENRMVNVWERVFHGALRQVQYICSLSTATKLPEVGQWHGLVLGGGLGNLKSKLVPLDQSGLAGCHANRPMSREPIRPLSRSRADNTADDAPVLTIARSGQGALF